MVIKMKNKNRIFAISTAIIILVILVSIAIPLKNNKTEVTPIEIAKENNGLPKLESFENLYNMVIENRKDNIYETNSVDLAATEKSDTTQMVDNSDYSKTNTQVEGVDEADIVKVDGEYVYYIANNSIVIVGTNEGLKLISKINYNDEKFFPKELYVYDNKLVVIGNEQEYYNEYEMIIDVVYPEGRKTIAKQYNIINKDRPELERQIEIEGYYLSSRMINNNVYIISNKYIDSYLFSNNIEEMNENDFKPKYKDTVVSNEEQYLEYADISYFPQSDDMSYLNIVGFNINSNEAANIESYLGAGNEIYCSLNNLYIAKVKYEYKDEKMYGYYNNYDINTYIYKFKLENSKVTYVNVGSVPGSVLNQFSMDEKDEYFRIATTDSKNFANETNVNNLYVLNENLQMVGKVENLAKGERIYSVRFMGNRAYMVTFVQTDPLFVIDLSVPENPIVLGELKIPGYSKYLHPYDETHIIGFGENTTTNEYGGVVTDGMKMALFDVSNPSNPRELFSQDVGERGTNSEILYNHKALLFSKEKNIIAFPVFITEEIGEYRTNLKFQGAIVYGVDLENGFIEKGKIAHQEIEEGTFDYDYTKIVERIIYIKDNLYTLSEDLIKETNMETMEEKSKLELN